MSRRIALAVLVMAGLYGSSCKKTPAIDEYTTSDTSGVLKNIATFPIGVGVKLDPFKNDAAYYGIVRNHFNSITLQNELKHVSVVSNEGAMQFNAADEMVSLAQAQGLTVFGHTLVDWQSTNTVYMRSLRATDGGEVNAVPNPGFESGTGNNFTNWITQVGPGATGSFQEEVMSPHQGGRAMRIQVDAPGPFQYSMQAYSDFFGLAPGQSYTVSFYAKAATQGSRIKSVIQNATYQEKTYFLTTSWQKYDWTFTVNENNVSLKFHFPYSGTFYIDNISLPRPAAGFSIDPAKIDTAMKRFITESVTRYKGKISAWDVVNEPLDDVNGALRNNPQPGSTTGDKFYYAEFLGSSYIEKALRYANAADPSAQLYINEAKLESNTAKLDSMIRLINTLKAAGVPLHGIGLQMHIDIKTDRGGIERALSRLAQTGLQIRISEMDIRTNPWNFFGYKASDADLAAQRDLYRFVVGAYHRLVPAAQRAGITFWDPTDKHSWIITNQGKEDAPTLFDVNYAKKPAYYGVAVALNKKG